MILKQVIFLLLLPLTLFCHGQPPRIGVENTYQDNDPVGPLFKFYYDNVSSPNELINGKEYLPYFFHGKTTPLLFSGEPENAILMIRGRVYTNLKLQYDTYLDEVIYTDTSRMIDNVYPMIALNKDIVDGFYFIRGGEGMDCRNFKFQVGNEDKMESGFYEIAYDGPLQFIIRHRSAQYNYHALNEYKYAPDRYILAGGKYRLISNNRSFLQLFGESSDLIREYMRSRKINIRRADKNEVIGLIRYSETIIQQERERQ